jgi:hypothetical protein
VNWVSWVLFAACCLASGFVGWVLRGLFVEGV